jgi:hypothetical protein
VETILAAYDDPLIWDVSVPGGDVAFLLFCGVMFHGRFGGSRARAAALEAATRFGEGHAIWHRAPDGVTTCVLPWPRP